MRGLVQDAMILAFPSTPQCEQARNSHTVRLPVKTTGEPMKLSISYKHVESQQAVENEVERHVEKLNKFLKCYQPDLLQLHGAFAVNGRKEEHTCTLNLSLPTGSLHATGTGKNVRACCKKAFSELEAQTKKHQALLRKDYQWKRKRPRADVLLAS